MNYINNTQYNMININETWIHHTTTNVQQEVWEKYTFYSLHFSN